MLRIEDSVGFTQYFWANGGLSEGPPIGFDDCDSRRHELEVRKPVYLQT